MYDKCPSYMKDLVKLKSNVHNTRSGVKALYVPNVKSQSKYNFGYSGTIMWNKLPSKIQKITCKSSFKSEAKKYLLEEMSKN